MNILKQPRPLQNLVLIAGCCLLFLPDGWAQKQEVDAVYLKNGEIFRGTLLDHQAPGLVQIETLCWNRRVFPAGEVEHIGRETVNLRSGRMKLPSSGYFNRTDLGILIGSGNNEKNAIFSTQMVNGYRINSRFYPGIGLGLEFYEQAVLPLFADLTCVLGRNALAPFVRGSAGYAFPLEDPPETWGVRTNNKGGGLYGAGIGTFIRLNGHNALAISLEYRFQSLKSTTTQDWNDEVLNLEKQYNRMALRVGFLFD
jgi:hypothetical protein